MDNLNREYNLIERYFHLTTEPYDDFYWDGETLLVFFNNKIIERYTKKDLKEIIEGF